MGIRRISFLLIHDHSKEFELLFYHFEILDCGIGFKCLELDSSNTFPELVKFFIEIGSFFHV